MASRARRATAEAAPPAARPAPTLVSPKVRLNGSLDRVGGDGAIEGWCWSPDEPQVQRRIAVLVDDAEVARIDADQPRTDLAAAGVGSGRHAFRFLLPSAAIRPGANSVVALRDLGTGQAIGAAVPVRWSGGAAASPTLSGSLDRVSRDGWVSGWCWFPERPEAHVELTVLVDDAPVGSVVADAFRPDLQQAGIGDGRHGFSYALPYASLAERGTLTVAVQDRSTGQMLGAPITMRLGRMAAAEERLQDLERQIRLLRGQIDELRRAEVARDDEPAAHALFATVAAFFQDLAEGRESAPGVTGLLRRHAAFALAVPERPAATICIAATAPFATLHACLRALHDARIDEAADVMVLDDGSAGADVALLPALVGNLRYVFRPDRADRDEAAASARGGLLVFLAPETRLAPDWLAEVTATFAREPEAAMVGGRLARADGLLQHAFLSATEDGRLADPAHLAPEDATEFGFLRPVDAVAGYAFAVRRQALRDAGGFSTLFARFGHAVADLCARLRARGEVVLYQPLATAQWHGRGGAHDAAPPDLALTDEETLRLRERLHGGWPHPVRFAGHALVIDDALPRPEHDAGSIATFEQMQLLRRLGWHVTFAPVHDGEPDGAARDTLARRGIEVVAPPRSASVTEYLQAEGARLDLVHIYRYANAAMLQERVRALAPRAKLVFATADLHFLREHRRAELAGLAPPAAERAAELRCMRAADATIVTSDYEHTLLRAEVDAARLVLLRWITRPVPPTHGFAERRDICFVGNFRHPPNLDGVRWFVEHVLPRVRARLPRVRLLLAGSDMPAEIGALASEAIEVLGWVPDLAELFGRVRLSVSPLRFGAGFKGKVATSLAHGLPVVGSSISLEGTGLAHGDGVAIADDPEQFAQAVVRLHEDEAWWQTQSARALERVAALYSPEAAMDVWRDMLGRLGLKAVS